MIRLLPQVRLELHMMVTRQAKRKFNPVVLIENPTRSVHTNFVLRIIQDCEDALTNWVTANAAVSSKLSTRAQNLSTRRKAGRGQHNQEGVDLSGQDQSLKDRESGLWVPAGAHREYDDDEEEEEDEVEPEQSSVHTGEARGREEARPTAV